MFTTPPSARERIMRDVIDKMAALHPESAPAYRAAGDVLLGRPATGHAVSAVLVELASEVDAQLRAYHAPDAVIARDVRAAERAALLREHGPLSDEQRQTFAARAAEEADHARRFAESDPTTAARCARRAHAFLALAQHDVPEDIDTLSGGRIAAPADW